MADFFDVRNKSSQVADTSPAVRDAAKGVKEKPIKKNRISRKKVIIPETIEENESDTDSDADIKTPDGTVVQTKKKNSSTDKTSENQVPDAQKRNKPQRKVPNPIPETKTNKYENDIKNAVMIYDTIDEAMKTKPEKYPYTKSFAQTKKTRKLFDKAKDFYNEVNRKYNTKNPQNSKNKLNSKENRKTANEERQKEKDELQESKVQAETDAKELVEKLLKIDFDNIKADHRLIIELHIKIQDVEGGPKAYITKLENEAMNMIGGKRGKRTRRKRQPVQKGGNNDDKEKKKKKLKIVNILKQLNSANYIDYEIESIIQELKRLLGRPSTVGTSIPKTIETTTTIQEDMYSEPLPICTDKDKNSNETCKKNREKLENRLKYFNKLKDLNAMHNDNELLAVAQSVIEENKENIEAYYKPYAKSDDTTNNKADKDKQYLATLKNFIKIQDELTNLKIKKYNVIVDHLNDGKNKKNIVNPQLEGKLMTTNIKQTKTGDTIFSNILSIEHVLGMINNFENNPTLLKAMNSTVDGKGDPGHTKTSSSSVVKSTDILRNKEPENNVEAK